MHLSMFCWTTSGSCPSNAVMAGSGCALALSRDSIVTSSSSFKQLSESLADDGRAARCAEARFVLVLLLPKDDDDGEEDAEDDALAERLSSCSSLSSEDSPCSPAAPSARRDGSVSRAWGAWFPLRFRLEEFEERLADPSGSEDA